MLYALPSTDHHMKEALLHATLLERFQLLQVVVQVSWSSFVAYYRVCFRMVHSTSMIDNDRDSETRHDTKLLRLRIGKIRDRWY